MKWIYSSRFAELLITSTTWIVIAIPLWLSPFHPAVVAYGIIAFDLYFLYQSMRNAYQSVGSYLLILKHSQTNYAALVTKSENGKDIRHFIIIPCYKESVEKLASTIQCILASDYPFVSNIHVVLGFEKREKEAPQKEQELKTRFEGKLTISASYHELASNEVPGKASNQTWATRDTVARYIDPKGFSPDRVILTICDADSQLPTNYFSYLTHTYLNDSDRLYHFYWAPVLLYNNFWKLPFFVRMQASLSSIVRLAYLQDKENLIQISSYSTSLKLIQDVGYWDVDIIPEDWHVYLQAYFTHGVKVRTVPLYTMINGDAVYSGSRVKTFLSRYEQEKRWAWGVSDIAYAWHKLWRTPHIPMLPKIKKILFLIHSHLLWPTSFFILTVFATVTPFINPVFKRTVMGFILPQVSGLILTLGSSMLVVYTILDIRVRKSLNISTKPQSLFLLAIQWYVLPIVSFFLSSAPALEAHTRLLLGKKITYKVTEKK